MMNVETTKRLSSLLMLCVASLIGLPRAAAQLPPIPVPKENPLTPEKIVLGKMLFWEEQMSSDNTVACGTCHRAEFGGADLRNVRIPGPDGNLNTPDDVFGSPGVIRSDENNDYVPDPVREFLPRVTGRLSPSFIGAQFFTELFWDGRAPSNFVDPETGLSSIAAGGALESQAVGPPLSDVEMAHADRDWSQVALKLEAVHPMRLASDLPPDMTDAIDANPTYPDLFASAFGDSQITAERIAMAIASYERILVPDQTPWDAGTLTPNQTAGLGVFLGQGRCDLCHTPPLFADDRFHNIGVRPAEEDLGRFEVTGAPIDRGRFKTPSLRNVGLRRRFMHMGRFVDLAQVVGFYNRGGDFGDNQDPLIVPLGLPPNRRAELVDFLTNGLTDPRVEQGLPPFDRPTLHSERIPPDPRLFGVGSPGSGGIVPTLLAVTPAAIANGDFKLGVHGGLGGAFAILAVAQAAAPPGEELDGIPIHIDLNPPPRRIERTLGGSGPGEGFATVQKGIPDRPSLVGKIFFLQWFVQDPVAVGGFAASRGAEISIF